jgi:hypothetical protein
MYQVSHIVIFVHCDKMRKYTPTNKAIKLFNFFIFIQNNIIIMIVITAEYENYKVTQDFF